MKCKRIIAALCAGMIAAAGIPGTVSASSLSKDELREKYKYLIDYTNESDGAFPIDSWVNGHVTDTDENGVGDDGVDYGPEYADARLTFWNDYYFTEYLSITPHYFGDYKEYNNFYYAIKPDQTVKLVGADWDELKTLQTEKLVLPSEIDGMPVNEVDSFSFGGAHGRIQTLKEIVVPDSVTMIREGAFEGAFGGSREKGTYKINIPEKVEYLGHMSYGLLYYALGEQVTLPETLEYIDWYAFGSDTYAEIIPPKSNFVTLNGIITYGIADPKWYEVIYDGYSLGWTSEPDFVNIILDDNCVTADDSKYNKAEYERKQQESKRIQEEVMAAQVKRLRENTPPDWYVIVGDADESMEADVKDAVLLARIVANQPDAELSDQGKKNADMNQDGVITSDDLTMLLRFLVKLGR